MREQDRAVLEEPEIERKRNLSPHTKHSFSPLFATLILDLPKKKPTADLPLRYHIPRQPSPLQTQYPPNTTPRRKRLPFSSVWEFEQSKSLEQSRVRLRLQRARMW